MAIAITSKQFIEEMTELINKELAEMPDDRTRQAVLDAFSKQMFCDTRKGTREMNNEPVAYINVEERKLEWAEPITWHTPTIAKMDKIPLYTHPVKELTDEEINELSKKAKGH